MKRSDLLLYCTLATLSILFGIWLRGCLSVPFTGFQGEFLCRDFGVPDRDYNVLRFTPTESGQVAVDALHGSITHEVGRLTPEGPALGRLELSMALVHSPALELNPLAEHFIEGSGVHVKLIGRLEGRELYRHTCSRVD